MSKLPKLSGADIVKIIVKHFGFTPARQTGCHLILRKFVDGKKVVTVVPMHKEVKVGTPMGILDLGKIDREEFIRKIR
ncbi:HicA toxin of bacterial toxin-antitoxin [uncultured archaeon]|nr:HicA toxin of bacterial toxin-antitoxin [uncultured archaeon]